MTAFLSLIFACADDLGLGNDGNSRPLRMHPPNHSIGNLARLRAGFSAFCCLLSGIILAQPTGFVARYLSTSEGLPDATVYDVEFDREGWMWVATSVGLYQYDGVSFVRYNTIASRHNEVHNLQLGPDGVLYALNFRRQLLRVQGDSLRVLAEYPHRSNAYLSYAALADGLYLHADQQIVCLEYGTYEEGSKLSFAPTEISRIVEYSSDEALLVDRLHRAFAKIGPTSIYEFKLREEVRTTGSATIDGETYVINMLAGQQRFVQPSPDCLTIRETTLPDSTHVRLVVEHHSGGLLAATERGVFWRKPQDTTWQNLCGGNISHLVQDETGSIWCSTLDRGLIQLSPTPYHAERYPKATGGFNRIARLPSGQLLAASRDLYLFQLGTQAVAQKTELDSYAFIPASDSSYFFGSHYLLREEHNDLHITSSGAPNMQLVNCGALLAKDVHLFGTSAGTAIWNNHAHQSYRLTPDLHLAPQSSATLTAERTSDVTHDPNQGALYVATLDTLLCWSASGNVRLSAKQFGSSPQTLDLLGPWLLVGTASNGLNVLHRSSLVRSTSTAQGNRPQAVVQGLQGRQVRRVRTHDQRAWVITERGVNICTLNRGDTFSCQLLAQPHADLPSAPEDVLLLEAPAGSSARDSVFLLYNQALLRADVDGVLQHHARSQQAVRTYVSSLEVAGQNVDRSAPLVVTAGEASLRVQLRTPYYDRSQGTQIRYKLLGLKGQHWQTIQTNHTAGVYFASLPAGAYDLVYGLDVPGAPLSSLAIEVLQPWYLRPWVWLVTGVASTALLTLGLVFQVRRQARKAKQVAELRQTKLAAIAAQMNPHFLFNALHSLQEFILKQDIQGANAYLAKFARLVRLTLQHSQAETVSLSKELEAIRLYAELEQRRLDGRVQIDISVDADLPQDIHFAPLLVQPHVENAFKHGLAPLRSRPGRLDVRYSVGKTPGVFVVQVCDNGVGRKKTPSQPQEVSDAKRTGFGVSATQQRLKLLRDLHGSNLSLHVEDLVDEHGSPAGTRVQLLVPYVSLPPKLNADDA